MGTCSILSEGKEDIFVVFYLGNRKKGVGMEVNEFTFHCAVHISQCAYLLPKKLLVTTSPKLRAKAGIALTSVFHCMLGNTPYICHSSARVCWLTVLASHSLLQGLPGNSVFIICNHRPQQHHSES